MSIYHQELKDRDATNIIRTIERNRIDREAIYFWFMTNYIQFWSFFVCHETNLTPKEKIKSVCQSRIKWQSRECKKMNGVLTAF